MSSKPEMEIDLRRAIADRPGFERLKHVRIDPDVYQEAMATALMLATALQPAWEQWRKEHNSAVATAATFVALGELAAALLASLPAPGTEELVAEQVFEHVRLILPWKKEMIAKLREQQLMSVPAVGSA